MPSESSTIQPRPIHSYIWAPVFYIAPYVMRFYVNHTCYSTKLSCFESQIMPWKLIFSNSKTEKLTSHEDAFLKLTFEKLSLHGMILLHSTLRAFTVEDFVRWVRLLSILIWDIRSMSIVASREYLGSAINIDWSGRFGRLTQRPIYVVSSSSLCVMLARDYCI